MFPYLGNRGWACLGCVLAMASLGPAGLLRVIPVSLTLVFTFIGVALWKGANRYDILAKKEQEGRPLFSFRPPSIGLPFALNPRPRIVPEFGDARITGSHKVDAPLNEIINFIFRDYVHSWYAELSLDPEFPQRLRVAVTRLVAAAANHIKDADWIDFLTSNAVDDFASHMKLFRTAEKRVKEEFGKVDDKKLYAAFFDLESEMERRRCRDIFCADEDALKSYWKEIIDVILFLLMDPKDFHNKAFRVMLKEILINLVVIPTVDSITEPEYVNQTVSWLCEEAALNNEAFLTVVKETEDEEELEAVKAKVEQDLSFHRSRDTGGVGKKKDASIEDTKQTIRSLEFLLKTCQSRLKKESVDEECETESLYEFSRYLQPGCVLYSVPLETVLGSNRALSYFIDFLSDPSEPRQHYVFFYLAVEAYRAQYQVEIQSAEEGELDYQLLRASAQTIYDMYLAPKAFPRVELSNCDASLTSLAKCLLRPIIAEDVFNLLQDAVFNKLENHSSFYAKFKKQEAYVQLLADFDLLHGEGGSEDGGSCRGKVDADGISITSVESYEGFVETSDGVSSPSTASTPECSTPTAAAAAASASSGDFLSPNPSLTQSRSAQFLNALTGSNSSLNRKISNEQENPQPTHFYTLDAKIVNTVVCNGELGKPSYALYLVRVTKLSTLGDAESWQVARRYSDFDDLQRMLKKKFTHYSFTLPGKNFNRFSNMNAGFLEKRRLALDVYLHMILGADVLRKFIGSMGIVESFLSSRWDKASGQLGERIVAAADTVGSAIKNPFKAVTNSVRAFPLHLVRGVQGVGEGVKEASTKGKVGLDKFLKRGSPVPSSMGIGVSDINARVLDGFNVKGVLLPDTGRVGEGLSDDDNIPLRISLLLFDEIFDLGSNQWLRRRIVSFLRKIIKATFGDMINKKIMDYMESYITTTQIAEYVKQLRDSLWMDGVPIPASPPRDEATKARLRILTKTKMLGSLPDDLKRFIGNDTSKRGILRLYDLFQHQTLNKRLFFVLFEGVIKTVFPKNKLDEIFDKIYAHSPRITKKSEAT